MMGKILSESESKMKKSVEALKRDLATTRTGRATPALVEHLQVNYYDTPMPLNQLATISVPEAKLLTIQPWDKQALSHIEKAILQANLGLNPSNDSTIIRVPIPPLTEERRKEMVKMVQRRVETGRVSLRNIRRESLEQTRNLRKNQGLSEDEERRGGDKLNNLTEKYVKQMNDLGQSKTKELIEI